MRLFLITPFIALIGCIHHPDHPKKRTSLAEPKLNLPAHYQATPVPTPEIARSLNKLFQSSELNHYLTRALANNPDLRASAARLEEAGFNTRRSRAALLPDLTANSSATRSRNNSAGAGFNAGAFQSTRYSATLDSRWEIDVWGRIKAGVNAAASNEAAAAADYAAARQSIAAQTAQAYFSLVETTRRLALVKRQRKSFQETFQLVDRRFENGTGNFGDVSLAKTDVKNTDARIEQLKNSRDQAARLLATLTGSYPHSEQTAANWPTLQRRVPAGIPSSLLRRRPDIHAAYQRIRAADANITVAHANCFPSFSLTARAGQQTSRLKDLIDPGFTIWSLAGNLTAPLLDGGNLRAQLGAANSRAKQAIANYESTVLTALREVEDALGSEVYLARQESATREALKAARAAESRVLRNYESGLVEILTLLDTQRRSFATEEALIGIRSLRFQNRVNLTLALGKAY